MPYTPNIPSKMIGFVWKKLSSRIPGNHEIERLRAICDELDGLGLLTPYKAGMPVGSNGNLSCRVGNDDTFVVTASQLASKRGLSREDFVTVDRYEFPKSGNTEGSGYYNGVKLPSSESVLHWLFYRKHPEIQAVIHVHESTELLYSNASRDVWDSLGVIETARYGNVGTIDLPNSVEEVMSNLTQYVVLKGHYVPWDLEHTGTVVFGKDLDEAVRRVIDIHDVLVEVNAS